ncbi:MAG TPA: polyketide synthase, partial [Longimicrobium sp.]|nr:polyketide synthase [Longimicrobium sp.]
MSDSTEHDEGFETDIAVVGMWGRFPGAADIEEFWRNLEAGVESISVFGEEELAAAGVPATLYGRPDYVRARAVLDGADQFDAPFFGIRSAEAAATDPQGRVFLEGAWAALESAGHDPGTFAGAIGVYAGSSFTRHMQRVRADAELAATVGEVGVVLGSDKDFLATRVAYRLDLRGPGLTVQTACSTSLVAVHLACQALLSRECDMALAGGVSVREPQRTGYLYQEGAIYSPDGHCRAYGEGAAGTVSGSGAAVVVLRRLADAIADGDTVLAVVKGSAINNDGGRKVGFTAPGVDGQARVISEALLVGGVDPATLGYVEGHGTGTPMGDPIEVAALLHVLQGVAPASVALGSVKSNVGHLDAAAGAAGMIKAVLALRHAVIPRTLHAERPAPALGLEGGPLRLAAETAPWPRGSHPRRAGVSSFGIGGTNAHVVLE